VDSVFLNFWSSTNKVEVNLSPDHVRSASTQNVHASQAARQAMRTVTHLCSVITIANGARRKINIGDGECLRGSAMLIIARPFKARPPA